ncbi:hypothetical protein, partial [Pontixanthobacter luteolus]|uniref:hypothetical protein n=1 Tax=Pontixanthobacter luteolus TaxID=295089 RepID=UPI0023034941
LLDTTHIPVKPFLQFYYGQADTERSPSDSAFAALFRLAEPAALAAGFFADDPLTIGVLH